MDALQFADAYSVYSDGSNPRTPSPGTSGAFDDVYHTSPGAQFKQPFEFDPFPSSSVTYPDIHQAVDVLPPAWSHAHASPLQQQQGPGRVSLLQELYEPDMPSEHPSHHSHPNDAYMQHSAEPHYGGGDWSAIPSGATAPAQPMDHHHGGHHHPAHTLPPMRAPHDGMVRRNTFPYVRHDQEQVNYTHPAPAPPAFLEHGQLMGPYAGRPDMVYGEPMSMHGSPHMPLAAEPSALHGGRLDDAFAGPHHYREFEPGHLDEGGVKLEDTPSMVQSHGAFYRPAMPGPGLGYPMVSPHTGLPIQHTDDAASKETQYLRRRCFNCHTTEPPSWRRSTLNPGKIVCNKCGLYERTHLRPRPLRFDELRAGNKARKQSKATASPKQSRPVKKESTTPANSASETMARRASVSSTTSSVNGGATSDWDDNVSVYSNGSASTSGFSSPAQPAFTLSRESASASPPMSHSDGGIRLPNGCLNDIAKAPSSYYPYSSPSETIRRNTVTLPLPPSDLRRPASAGEAEASMPAWGGMPLGMPPQPASAHSSPKPPNTPNPMSLIVA